MTHLDNLAIAMEAFADAVRGMDMGPLDHFTCTEADSLANLMVAYTAEEEEGIRVMLYHLGDGEEHDELAAHLETWPTLAAKMRAVYPDDAPILALLAEIEKEAEQ